MGLPDKARGVDTPHEVVGDVYAQIPDAGDHLDSCSSDVQGGGDVSGPPEVHNHLL